MRTITSLQRELREVLDKYPEPEKQRLAKHFWQMGAHAMLKVLSAASDGTNMDSVAQVAVMELETVITKLPDEIR